MKFGEHSLPMDPGAYAQYQAQYQAHAATRAQMQNGELDASYETRIEADWERYVLNA